MISMKKKYLIVITAVIIIALLLLMPPLMGRCFFDEQCRVIGREYCMRGIVLGYCKYYDRNAAVIRTK